MSNKIIFEALVNIWKTRKNAGGIRQFAKFSITGGMGTITNLAIFFLLADKINMPEIPVSIFCFMIAATQNYIINHKWSFKDNMAFTSLSFKKWLEFICGSLFGLGINIIVMKTIILLFEVPYKFFAQAAGIAAGMTVNFIVSKYFVFNEKRGRNGGILK
jgi:putative flippase GtrA